MTRNRKRKNKFTRKRRILSFLDEIKKINN